MMTFFTVPRRCFLASLASVKRPVDSTTISAPTEAQSSWAGSFSANTLIFLPPTVMEPASWEISSCSGPSTESYFSKCASVLVSVRSLTATNSTSLRCRPARTTFRPMRPKPLIPTLTAIFSPVLSEGCINTKDIRRRVSPQPQAGGYSLKSTSQRLVLIQHLAADDRIYDIGRRNLIFGNGHDVAREDGDVGQLAGFERPFHLLLERGVGIVPRVRPQGFFARHALVGIENRAVLQLAADGGVEAGDRANVFHRRVGAVIDDGAALHELLPDVRALFGPLRAQARQHVGSVGSAVD